ncbi:Glycine/D-amino acid oxidase [Rhodospirillales bacterium URHD0017]|nr:Glycine/D-amino acid oxidase [Rhodospirillales bacterium URHD0017]
MLSIDGAQHRDLRTGRAPWASGRRPTRRTLKQDRRCDVLVVGAGITGALAAERLVREGRDVCIVDRERPGLGSTAASTAMLLWEIDRPLAGLTDLYGFERAARLYRLSLQAVRGLQSLVEQREIACRMRARHSLYLAAGTTDAHALMKEHELRGRAGLPGHFLDYRTLHHQFGIDREAALLSSGAADADPLCLAHGLLARAVEGGGHLFDADAVHYDVSGRRTAVLMDDGHSIEADWVVLATGYVMPDFVASEIHRVTTTWAVATPPQPRRGRWRGGALIWEATEHYLDLRTTDDHRIVVGGGDDETINEPDARANATPGKSQFLLAGLRRLFPDIEPCAETAWSGVFGTTADGLPLIGPVPGHPRILAAYGYGGNGITFGFLAAELIAGVIGGRRAAWYDDFPVGRPMPPALK